MVVQTRRSTRGRHAAHRKDEAISDAKILRAVREVLDRLGIRLAAASEQPPLSRRSSRSSHRRASSTVSPSGYPPRPRREQRNRSRSRPEQQPTSHRRSVQRREPETDTQRDPAPRRSPQRNHATPSESEPPPQPIPRTRPLAADYERSVLELRRSFGLMDSQSDVALGRPCSPAKGEVTANPRRQSVLELPLSTRLQGGLQSVSVCSPYMTRSAPMSNGHGEGSPADRGCRTKSSTPAPAAVAAPAPAINAPEPVVSGPERTKPAGTPTPEAGILPQEPGATVSEPTAPAHAPTGVYAPTAVRIRTPRSKSRDQSSRPSRRRHCASNKKKLGTPHVTESSQAADSTEVVPECLDAVVLLMENCRQSVAVRMSTTRFFLRRMWASRST